MLQAIMSFHVLAERQALSQWQHCRLDCSAVQIALVTLLMLRILHLESKEEDFIILCIGGIGTTVGLMVVSMFRARVKLTISEVEVDA